MLGTFLQPVVHYRRRSLMVLLGFQLLLMSAPVRGAGGPAPTDCRVERTGDLLTLSSPFFRWVIDVSAGLKAVQCENLMTGSKVDLHGGEEASLRFSGAHFGGMSSKGFDVSGQQRFELVDWTQATGGAADEHPDEEKGFAAGYYQPDFNDLNWTLTASPWELTHGAPRVHLVEDEIELLPGLKYFWVGVHHRGSMAFITNTSKGRVAVSDSAFVFGNIENNHCIGVFENLFEWHESYARITAESDIWLPIHDPELMTRYPGGDIA